MTGSFRVGDWQVEPQLNLVQLGDHSVHLEPKVMDVLCYLADHAGEVLNKERLIQAVWPDTFVTDDVLKYAIVSLRKAFEDDASDPRYIRTIPRRGYQLIADVLFPEEPKTKTDRYRLLRKLGQGGMGEVYLAEDTELGRRVALKFLHEDKEADPTWHRRLKREARAAAALDHPFICKIYDTGILAGRSFIAMEYVEGEKLSDRLKRSPLPLPQALGMALEVAEALEMAHRHGIVHRDIKPSNILLTEQGHAKITDFGIARKFRKEEADGQQWTLTQSSGEVAGTPDYMSPEQIRGEPVDQRSDLFQFAIVLYEMVAGRRPFEGDSRLATLTSVLNQEPKPIRAIAPHLPAELETLVNRCLKKDPERRIQHMDDLRLALTELKEDLDRGRSVGRRRRTAGLMAAAAVLAAVAAGWFYLTRPGDRALVAELRAVPLTSYPGSERSPSFSPDGTQVAFEWNGERQDNFDIYVKQIGVEPPSRLTTDPARDFSPAWSPDGRTIAFLRYSEDTTSISLVLIPQRGGRERILATEDVSQARESLFLALPPGLCWTPDSRWLACPVLSTSTASWLLHLFSVSTGEKRQLIATPDELLQGRIGGFWGDTAPAFSPDGRSLLFSRQYSSKADLLVQPLADDYRPEGECQRIRESGSGSFAAATWLPVGGGCVFSFGSILGRGLWRMTVSPSAEAHRLPFVPDDAIAPAVSPRGDRLAYQVVHEDADIWRVDLGEANAPAAAPVRLIASTRQDLAASYSPDGKRIAFQSDRSGAWEIWTCDSDGSNAAQLTSFAGSASPMNAVEWSPDGRSLVFDLGVAGQVNIYVLRADGGVPRRLTEGPGYDKWPNYSQDGRFVYFASDRSGTGEIWKVPAGGGQPIQVTRDPGADVPQESRDGKALYYKKGWPFEHTVWRIPVEGGEATQVLEGIDPIDGATVGRDGIYFCKRADEKGGEDLCLYEFASAKVRKLITLDLRFGYCAAVISPDARTILYTKFEESGSDLMLVENFR